MREHALIPCGRASQPASPSPPPPRARRPAPAARPHPRGSRPPSVPTSVSTPRRPLADPSPNPLTPSPALSLPTPRSVIPREERLPALLCVRNAQAVADESNERVRVRPFHQDRPPVTVTCGLSETLCSGTELLVPEGAPGSGAGALLKRRPIRQGRGGPGSLRF